MKRGTAVSGTCRGRPGSYGATAVEFCMPGPVANPHPATPPAAFQGQAAARAYGLNGSASGNDGRH